MCHPAAPFIFFTCFTPHPLSIYYMSPLHTFCANTVAPTTVSTVVGIFFIQFNSIELAVSGQVGMILDDPATMPANMTL